jgi:hypothetical protein
VTGTYRAQDRGKVQRETDLYANPWTRNVSASEQTKVKSQAVTKRVLPANESLELSFAQITVVCKPSIKLGAQGKPRREIVED